MKRCTDLVVRTAPFALFQSWRIAYPTVFCCFGKSCHLPLLNSDKTGPHGNPPTCKQIVVQGRVGRLVGACPLVFGNETTATGDYPTMVFIMADICWRANETLGS